MKFSYKKPAPMTMEQAVVSALSGINPKSERLESFIYYRNRLAQLAVTDFINANYVKSFKFTDPVRAAHYGVDTGTVVWAVDFIPPTWTTEFKEGRHIKLKASLTRQARAILRNLK